MANCVPSNACSTLPVCSFQAAPSVSTNPTHDRRCANFPPSKWSNYFTGFAKRDLDLGNVSHEIEELRAEVRQQLNALASEPLKQLKMVDAIQLLGLGYHFSEEIEQTLESLSANIFNTGGYDLYHTSLCFRLLRQHGYNVSSAIFNRFINTNGGLIEDLLSDVQGMLSFYEAAQLRLHKDAALDEVVAKCATHLESIAPNLNPSLNRQVTAALKQSLHKDIPRLQAWKYFSTYQEDESHDKTLLKLAKLDFNLLQKYHQQELSHISKWWKDLDLPSKCHYARDRLVEAYIWALTLYYEPQYSLGRMIFTKVIALAAVLDDTYDAYGTIDELELLTEAISRGDTSSSDKMPTYARALYQTLLGFYDEIEVHLAREGRSYQMPYLKEAVQITCVINPLYYNLSS
uniref:Uncharacterized protein n=1 Tax=Kalanchoe fedtschenkoi TaxID=63787 RepID=A0A7N0V974_KALFE